MQPSLTIVSVTGDDSYVEGSLYAIMISYHALQERVADLRCLLVSPSRPKNLPDYIQHVAVKPFSYLEYNLFMLYLLADLIDTDFVLTVQNDGFIINAKNWSDDFFQYDYIGAPVHCVVTTHSNHIETKPLQSIPLKPLDNHQWIPQNGGFSWRSRRILQAPRYYNLFLEIPAPHPLNQADHIKKIQWRTVALHHEDVFLSVQYRSLLEKQGIRFAPIDVAYRFSNEGALFFPAGIKPDEIFGLHYCSMFVLTGMNELTLHRAISNTSIQEIVQYPMNQQLIKLGFNLIFPNHLIAQG